MKRKHDRLEELWLKEPAEARPGEPEATQGWGGQRTSQTSRVLLLAKPGEWALFAKTGVCKLMYGLGELEMA